MSKEAMQQALEALEWIAAQRTGGMIQRKATEPIAALRAALAEQEQPVAWPVDVTLDQPACKLLHAMVTPALPDDDEFSAVRLLIGHGHSGYGLYVASSEYPEEGAELLAGLSAPTPPAPVAPPGWRMVPVEPPEKMLDVMHDRIRILCNPSEQTASIRNDREVWAAMLSAAAQEAPAPPAPQPLTELPPLPEPHWPRGYHGSVPSGGYTADQMHAYARAVEAEVLKRMGVQR